MDNKTCNEQASVATGEQAAEGSVKVETSVKAGVAFPSSALTGLPRIDVRLFDRISSVLVR